MPGTYRILILSAVGALLAGPVARAGDAAGGYFEDERWGYKIRVPQDWTQVAMSADEEWIASKHIGKRELEPKKSEYYVREAPEMWVIGFPHARRERTAKRIETPFGSELLVKNPYRDYKHFISENKNFLTRSWEDSGYYFSKEEETEIGGVKVTQYEIKVEKMVNAPRRVVAWVYHFEDVDFAVQFKILEDHFDGYERGFRACLKSFQRIKRTKSMPGAATTGAAIVDADDLEKLPPEERKRALKDLVKRKYQREIDALPDDWKHKESEHYLFLYSCDEKFMRRTMKHAEVVRDHLDDLFGGIGDRFVPKTIVRIFSSDAAREAYSDSTRDIWDVVREILMVEGSGWEKDWEYGWFNRQLFGSWLYYRNRNLSENMPSWLSSGLMKYMEMLRSKGKRVDFANEDWGRDRMRLQIKAGEYVPLKEMMTSEVWSMGGQPQGGLDPFKKSQQAESVVYWLMTECKRGKYKNVVKDYLSALISVVQEVETEFRKELEAKQKQLREAQPLDPDSEEEEEGAPAPTAEDFMKLFQEKRTEILEETFKRAFGSWDDRDWELFTKAWARDAK